MWDNYGNSNGAIEGCELCMSHVIVHSSSGRTELMIEALCFDFTWNGLMLAA